MDARRILFTIVAIAVAIAVAVGLVMASVVVIGVAIAVGVALRILFWIKKPDIEAMQEQMMQDQEMQNARTDDGVIDLEPNDKGEYGGRK